MSTLSTSAEHDVAPSIGAAHRPFRTEVRTTQGEVATIKGSSFDAVARAIELIGRARADDVRLGGWIQHSDERVPLAVLRDALAPALAARPEHGLHLYWRAMRDAEREHVIWTPLLDRLATSGAWPATGGTIVVAGHEHHVAPETVDTVLAPLIAWCAAHPDDDALADIHAAFRAPQLLRRIAHRPETREAPGGQTPAGPAATISVREPSGPGPVAPAGSTPEAVAAVFAALQDTGAMSATATSTRAVPDGREPVATGAAGDDYRAQVSLAMSELAARATTWTPADMNVLLDAADQATGHTDERSVPPDARAAIDALLDSQRLAAETLHRLYAACRRIRSWVVRIVSHAAATVELWRNALRDNNWVDVREALCGNRVARRDAVIRRILSRSSSTAVLAALCLDGDADDVPQLIRRLAPQDPWALLRSLAEAVRTTGLRLTAGDLSPLLARHEPGLQSEALRLLHLMVRPA